MKKLSLILKIIAVTIMLQTLYFKFTAHPMSVSLFTKLGIEPYGRIGIGIMELIASVLFLFPKVSWLGAGLTLGLMSGAIFSHLTKLGIYVDGDPWLFIYACAAWVATVAWLLINRKHWMQEIKRLLKLN